MAFVTEVECAYCVLRNESVSTDQLMFILFKRLRLKICEVHVWRLHDENETLDYK